MYLCIMNTKLYSLYCINIKVTISRYLILIKQEGEIMPFVTVNILEGKGKEYIKKVSDSINEAVIETMAFPDDDRYQVINQLSDDCLQYQGRESDRVMMHLVMRSGRSNKAKQAFYAKVVEYLSHRVQIKPENVFITITENHDVDFSFKDGVAQFVV